MSVSNAFGSNTFNIFIALAVPWLVGAQMNGGSCHAGLGLAQCNVIVLHDNGVNTPRHTSNLRMAGIILYAY